MSSPYTQELGRRNGWREANQHRHKIRPCASALLEGRKTYLPVRTRAGRAPLHAGAFRFHSLVQFAPQHFAERAHHKYETVHADIEYAW